jgi:hypothetical protein
MENNLKQMLIKANEISAHYNSIRRFGEDSDIFDINSNLDNSTALEKSRKTLKVDIEIVRCKAHRELDRLVEEYGEFFRDTPIEEGKWKYTYEELQTINLDELIANPVNDAFWIVDFLKSSYNTIKEHLKEFAPHVFVDGVSTTTYKDSKSYIVSNIAELLKLNKDNEIHSNLIKVLEKIYDYYKDNKQLSDTISSKEIYLKQELLAEDPSITQENLNEGIDNILEYHIYHYDNTVTAKQVLELVAMVFENGDTLQDIERLTAEDDWNTVIRSYYNEYEPQDEEVFYEEVELPEGYIDILDIKQVAKECNEDYIKRQKKTGGKTSKQNHKVAITIKNIETNETHTFDSSDECAKFLKLSKRTMIRFKQGTTKLNKTWQIVDEQGSGDSSVL